MKISVIIPALNENQHIGRTVSHIRHHGGDRILEVLVVDGGSTDNTVELAETAGATVLPSPVRSRGAQIDLGARQSRGEVLYFVHADTLPPASFALDIEMALTAGWQLGNFKYRFDSTHPLLRFNAACTRFRWFFTQGGDRTFFILKNTYLALGGYDPSFVIMEEYDFLRRAMRAGYNFVILPSNCLVSARKYKQNSWLRVQLANLLTYNLWSLGMMEPVRLKGLYRKMLR